MNKMTTRNNNNIFNNKNIIIIMQSGAADSVSYQFDLIRIDDPIGYYVEKHRDSPQVEICYNDYKSAQSSDSVASSKQIDHFTVIVPDDSILIPLGTVTVSAIISAEKTAIHTVANFNEKKEDKFILIDSYSLAEYWRFYFLASGRFSR